MHRLRRSAVRGYALTRVPECDMCWLAAGFVFVISAEAAISWRIRSVAGHGWFGLDHLGNPKTQIPKTQIPSADNGGSGDTESSGDTLG
jgi:hypothetical protein